MDVQRSNKRGKANYFVVIPVTHEDIKNNLREVHAHLEAKYPSARAELRRAFIDLDSNQTHITLFAIHANKERLVQVRRAISKFTSKVKDDQLDFSFDLELKGLGSWHTKGGNIIVYADLTWECAATVKVLAKQIRDHVMAAIEEEEGRPSLLAAEEGEDEEEEAEGEEELEMEKDAHNFDDEAPKDFVEDFPGLWMDDPLPRIYIPHVTLMNSDPDWDKRLRMRLLARSQHAGTRAGAGAGARRRGGKDNKKGGKGGKGWDRSRRAEGGGGEERWNEGGGGDSTSDEEEEKEENEGQEKEEDGGSKWEAVEVASENFGHDYGLLRDVRSDFSKTSFGRERVKVVELQSGFQLLETIPITYLM